MKYSITLPLTAFFALSIISLLVSFDIIPPGSTLLNRLQSFAGDGFYFLIFIIILLESIVYMGFYFPGQFFAVLLVIGAEPTPLDIAYLTLSMVCAATVGSIINYKIGQFNQAKYQSLNHPSTFSLRSLLVAMIHINSLAFFMVNAGVTGKPIKIVWFAALLNLPYYLLLIAGTAVLSEEVMAMAENTTLLITIILTWLFVALYLDVKNKRITWPIKR